MFSKISTCRFICTILTTPFTPHFTVEGHLGFPYKSNILVFHIIHLCKQLYKFTSIFLPFNHSIYNHESLPIYYIYELQYSNQLQILQLHTFTHIQMQCQTITHHIISPFLQIFILPLFSWTVLFFIHYICSNRKSFLHHQGFNFPTFLF